MIAAWIDYAKTESKQAAETARKPGLTMSLIAAMSLLIGAFIVAVAALLGGSERDQKEALLASGRLQ